MQNSLEVSFNPVPLTWSLFEGISPTWGVHLLLKASRNPPWNKTLSIEKALKATPASNSCGVLIALGQVPHAPSSLHLATMWAYVLLPSQTTTGRVLSCLALLWAGTTSNRPQEKWFGRGSCFEIFPRYTLFTIIHSLFWIKISYSWGNDIKTVIQSKRALLNFLCFIKCKGNIYRVSPHAHLLLHLFSIQQKVSNLTS